jgi:pyruvate/2-oxoglutarate dehydrogenase complex dihydrolipoamide dehydrogenase (E3) component
MIQRIHTDICVIGAGSGGLSVAAGASQMGARVVLVERGRMGGDCLNYGCVPSKALIAAAHAAEAARGAARFGIRVGAPSVDHAAVHDHIRGVIEAIAPNDSAERFGRLGALVIPASARFTGPNTVAAGDYEIGARRFVIATGSSPVAPPIPGLAEAPYLTNETIFENRTPIGHLIVIGGGPIGMEIAQAYRRLGAQVTVIEMFAALAKDDPELAELVKRQIVREGAALHEGVQIRRVGPAPTGIAVSFAAKDGPETRVEGTHLLVAAGRAPTLDGLGLEAAGIRYGPAGVEVDDRLRTSNRKVFAIGDAAIGYRFTHIAGYHAGIVLRNALFRLPAKVDYRAVPWVTYTAPELAHVGLGEAEARRRHGEIRVLRSTFAENDRAQAERDTEGVLKVITTSRGVVVGAGMVGAHAGEAIQLWCLAIAKRLKVKDVAGLILPYPTLGEINKRAAGTFYTPALFGPRMRRLVRLLLRLG